MTSPYDLTGFDQPDTEPAGDGEDLDTGGGGGEEPSPPVLPRARARYARLGQKVKSGRAPGVVRSGATMFLAVIGYAIGQNYVTGGMPRVRAWTAAKLANKLPTPPTAHQLQPNIVPPGFGGPGGQLNVVPPLHGPSKQFGG